jgi:hypothetical protein
MRTSLRAAGTWPIAKERVRTSGQAEACVCPTVRRQLPSPLRRALQEACSQPKDRCRQRVVRQGQASRWGWRSLRHVPRPRRSQSHRLGQSCARRIPGVVEQEQRHAQGCCVVVNSPRRGEAVPPVHNARLHRVSPSVRGARKRRCKGSSGSSSRCKRSRLASSAARLAWLRVGSMRRAWESWAYASS